MITTTALRELLDDNTRATVDHVSGVRHLDGELMIGLREHAFPDPENTSRTLTAWTVCALARRLAYLQHSRLLSFGDRSEIWKDHTAEEILVLVVYGDRASLGIWPVRGRDVEAPEPKLVDSRTVSETFPDDGRGISGDTLQPEIVGRT